MLCGTLIHRQAHWNLCLRSVTMIKATLAIRGWIAARQVNTLHEPVKVRERGIASRMSAARTLGAKGRKELSFSSGHFTVNILLCSTVF